MEILMGKRLLMFALVSCSCTFDYGTLKGRAAVGDDASVGAGGAIADGGSTSTGGVLATGGGGATGGAVTTGGGTGTAGTSATGGSTGKGGSTVYGGSVAAGGAAAGGALVTGGRIGSGGVMNNGGVTGVGGLTSSGGTNSTGGAGAGGGIGSGGAAGTDGGTGGVVAALEVTSYGDSCLSLSGTILVHVEIIITGSADIEFSTVTLRYWFTDESPSLANIVSLNYVSLGPGSASGTFVPGQSRIGGDTYLQIQFFFSLTSKVSSGHNSMVDFSIHKLSYDDVFDESNDYSCVATATSPTYLPNPKITAYIGNALVWGTEPPLSTLSSASARSSAAAKPPQTR